MSDYKCNLEIRGLQMSTLKFFFNETAKNSRIFLKPACQRENIRMGITVGENAISFPALFVGHRIYGR